LLSNPGNTSKRVRGEKKPRKLRQAELLAVRRSVQALSRKQLDSQHSKVMVLLRRDSGSVSGAKLKLSAWAEATLRKYVLLRVDETATNIYRWHQKNRKRSCDHWFLRKASFRYVRV
jgi:hypothetical protein